MFTFVGTDGEADVYGLQHDGHARPRPQQLMLLPSCSIHALRGKAGESVSHTHTHTHTHTLAYFPSGLPCMIWFEFIFIFCYCYRTSHPCQIHSTCTYKHKKKTFPSLSFCRSNTYARTHIDTHSRLSLFYYNVCQLVWCISRCPEHTLVPLLLVSTSSAWRWSHQKQSSQSELSETERTRERNRLVEKAGRRV